MSHDPQNVDHISDNPRARQSVKRELGGTFLEARLDRDDARRRRKRDLDDFMDHWRTRQSRDYNFDSDNDS